MSAVAVGIGVRDPHVDALLALRDRRALDVLEVMIDDGLLDGPRRRAWRALGARWPLVAHGTELGIADAEGVDDRYVGRVDDALRAVSAHWYSEHLAFLRAGSLALGHFGPTDDEADTLAALARNADAVRARVRCALLLENPADVLGLAGGGRDAGRRLGQGFSRALEAARAGALLDLTNLVINARNDGYDPADFLDAMAWERVVEVHLAGGHRDGALWIDSHARAVDPEALDWLPEVARRARDLRAVLIERDDAIPDLGVLLDEVESVRAALARTGRG